MDLATEVEGRVYALREEAERLRTLAAQLADKGLHYASAVALYEASRNDEAAALEAGDGEVHSVTTEGLQIVARPLSLPVSEATVTLTPAERTVAWWLPVVVLVALLVIAAGLGLLFAHIVKGGL